MYHCDYPKSRLDCGDADLVFKVTGGLTYMEFSLLVILEPLALFLPNLIDIPLGQFQV